MKEYISPLFSFFIFSFFSFFFDDKGEVLWKRKSEQILFLLGITIEGNYDTTLGFYVPLNILALDDIELCSYYQSLCCLLGQC